MRSATAGFALGVGWLQVQPALPSHSGIGLLFACAVLLALLASYARRIPVKLPLLAASGAVFGFAWAACFAQFYLTRELPKEIEGRDVTIVGTIDSLPARLEQGVRFNFAVEQVVAADGSANMASGIPPRLALAWYSGFGKDETQAPVEIRPGERWQLTVRLRRPHGHANPHGFDYEAWLLEQNLRATGYVRPDEKSAFRNQRREAFVWSFGNMVERSRGWLRDRIEAALPDRKYAGVIVALVVGDQRAVNQSDWKVFNRTGVGHLISISGLHITMVAGLFAALLLWLWRRSFFLGSGLPLVLPAQKAAALGGAAVALLYVLLAGFGVPAQRTLYMLSVVALALWTGRIASVSHVLAVALAAVLLLDPWAVLWPGFWLSFGAVAVILYVTVGRGGVRADDRAGAPAPGGIRPGASAPRQDWLSRLRAAALAQYAVTVGLVPLTVLLFGQVSLISPLANAVAIPLISFVVTPLALAGSVAPAPLSSWLLRCAHTLVEWLAQGLAWLSDLPAAVWAAPVPSPWMFAAALLGALWLLAPRGWPLRWLGMLAWLPLLVNVPQRPPAGQMWVTAFDVGQGTALLIETAKHRLLYDTGPFYSPESDGGSRVIVPYLHARGIRTLDAVVISHNDNDHSGGALSVFDQIEVGWVSSSLAPDTAIVKKAPDHRRCAAGQGWTWDGVRFDMLHPTAASYGNARLKPNARSCTLKATLGGLSILLPGDIEAAQEAELVGANAPGLRASVLVAPHHGSGTSSTAVFLHAVQPGLAVFQVGYRNRYHHPKQEVFERYGNLGIRRMRNDESGALSLRFGATLEVAEYRLEHARYWHGR